MATNNAALLRVKIIKSKKQNKRIFRCLQFSNAFDSVRQIGRKLGDGEGRLSLRDPSHGRGRPAVPLQLFDGPGAGPPGIYPPRPAQCHKGFDSFSPCGKALRLITNQNPCPSRTRFLPANSRWEGVLDYLGLYCRAHRSQLGWSVSYRQANTATFSYGTFGTQK